MYDTKKYKTLIYVRGQEHILLTIRAQRGFFIKNDISSCPFGETRTYIVSRFRTRTCIVFRVDEEVSKQIAFGTVTMLVLSGREISIQSGTIPRNRSYHLAGFLPQKLRDAIQ